MKKHFTIALAALLTTSLSSAMSELTPSFKKNPTKKLTKIPLCDHILLPNNKGHLRVIYEPLTQFLMTQNFDNNGIPHHQFDSKKLSFSIEGISLKENPSFPDALSKIKIIGIAAYNNVILQVFMGKKKQSNDTCCVLLHDGRTTLFDAKKNYKFCGIKLFANNEHRLVIKAYCKPRKKTDSFTVTSKKTESKILLNDAKKSTF